MSGLEDLLRSMGCLRHQYNRTKETEGRIAILTEYRVSELLLAVHQLRTGDLRWNNATGLPTEENKLASLLALLYTFRLLLAHHAPHHDDFLTEKNIPEEHVYDCVLTIAALHAEIVTRPGVKLTFRLVAQWFSALNKILSTLCKLVLVDRPMQIHAYKADDHDAVKDVFAAVALLPSVSFVDVDSPKKFFENWAAHFRSPANDFDSHQAAAFLRRRWEEALVSYING